MPSWKNTADCSPVAPASNCFSRYRLVLGSRHFFKCRFPSNDEATLDKRYQTPAVLRVASARISVVIEHNFFWNRCSSIKLILQTLYQEWQDYAHEIEGWGQQERQERNQISYQYNCIKDQLLNFCSVVLGEPSARRSCCCRR